MSVIYAHGKEEEKKGYYVHKTKNEQTKHNEGLCHGNLVFINIILDRRKNHSTK